jgi:hypothetical protein
MAYQSEQLEQEVEAARWRLQATLEELRTRMTPGLVIDQVIEYARQGPARGFFRNLAREVQENPMPLVMLGISIAWLIISASRSSRAMIASAADSVSKKAAEIGTATTAAIDGTTDAAAHLATRSARPARRSASAPRISPLAHAMLPAVWPRERKMYPR